MPATIYPIASTGAMLDIGQERSRENTALAAEPGCTADSNCASAPIGTIKLSKKVSGSYNHPSGLTGGRCLTGIGLLMEGPEFQSAELKIAVCQSRWLSGDRNRTSTTRCKL